MQPHTINEEKTKFAIVSYKNKDMLNIEVIDASTNSRINKFEFDISSAPFGYYTQGIAMQSNYIYIVRGHWNAAGDHGIKKLYVINATTGNLFKTYSFSLQNKDSYKKIEPEGLVIINKQLYVMLPTIKITKQVLRLYPLIHTF